MLLHVLFELVEGLWGVPSEHPQPELVRMGGSTDVNPFESGTVGPFEGRNDSRNRGEITN